MTLQQIYYFVRAAEIGSINETAKQLYASQSSVSGAIRELERHYDVTLFHRSPRGISLTTPGEELLSELRGVVRKLDFLEEKYCNAEKRTLTLSVAAQHHICGLESFIRTVQEIGGKQYKICYIECCTSDILDSVNRGYTEVGLFFYPDSMGNQIAQELESNEMVLRLVRREKLHVILHRSHPLAAREAIHMEDLMEYPCVTYDRVFRSYPLSGDLIARCPMKIGVSDRATAFSLMEKLDAFVTATSFFPVSTESARFQTRPIEDAYMINIVAITKKNRVLSDASQQFLEYLNSMETVGTRESVQEPME